METKRPLAFFLCFFLLAGQGCYAQDPQATDPTSSPIIPMDVASRAASPEAMAESWVEGWYQGAEGYDKAVEDFKSTQKPMFVYMSVGWCPYCRKFEKGILSSPKVRDYMKDKIKVLIDPESGRRENAIASQYGIRGFPSFYLHPPQPGRAVQLYTSGTPEEFIQQVEEFLP